MTVVFKSTIGKGIYKGKKKVSAPKTKERERGFPHVFRHPLCPNPCPSKKRRVKRKDEVSHGKTMDKMVGRRQRVLSCVRR
jgi:hypothetical protein